MSRLAISALLIALVICALGWLSCVGDPQKTVIDSARASQRSDVDTMKLIPMPPERFRRDVNAAVHFASPEKVTQLCGGRVENKLLLACATSKPPQMAVPNPCLFADEYYARVLCHEIGHVAPNGWTEKHEAKSDIARPHEDMLYSPCPLAPRNVPRLQRRLT